MARRLMLIFLVLFCAVTAGAEPSIPATPAGRALAAWLEAFNSGDRARIDLFLKTYSPSPAQEALTSAQFRGQSGGVNLIAITRSEKYLIGFRVQEKSQPAILFGRIEVTASKTPAIQNFILRPVPREAVLDEVKLDAAERKQTIEFIITDLNRKMWESGPMREWVKTAQANPQLGTPDDVAPLAVFLAGRGSDYITGQIMAVDGGYSTTDVWPFEPEG